MSELRLHSTTHPDKTSQLRYDSLLGLSSHKQSLLDELILILDPDRLSAWQQKHHSKGLGIIQTGMPKAPLIIFSGEVGCGKSALATSVGTPLAKELDRQVISLETPSDIRGMGRVGEISARITETFAQATSHVKGSACGILIVDEADDLATSRGQLQAHHEDRAGVNVLVKQVDQLARNQAPLAVIMITNRQSALDSAVTRRAALQLRFDRPDGNARREIFEYLLSGTRFRNEELTALVKASERKVPFTYSDLVERLARTALRSAWRDDCAMDATVLHAALKGLEPSPLVDSDRTF